MHAAIKAGGTYFSSVFIVAFMLGSFRVLVMVPRFGEIVSVSIEAPIILAVSWFVSRWTTGKFGVAREVPPRLLMGAVAFALLMLAELGLSVLVFGRSVETYFAAYWSAQGVIGLAAQIGFAFIPMIQRTK
jgi:hypothetical protein